MRGLIVVLLLARAACAQPTPPVMVLFDGESVAGLAGLELEQANVKAGAGAARWRNHPANPGVSFPVPADWRGYHLLRFQLHCAQPVPTAIMVVVSSENPATEGIDYWGYSIRLDFTGWREFNLPIGGDNGTRSPRGWDQIDSVTFNSSGWGNEPHPEADVLIDEVCLVHDPPRPGPRMTDEQFFAALDLNRPELAAVKAAVDAGELGRAKDALLQHFRERRAPRWWFDYRDRPAIEAVVTGGSDGWDYFGTSFVVDWVGWKQIELPLGEFGRSREPVGWQAISQLQLTATYNDQTPKAGTVLTLDAVDLVGDAATTRLSGFDTAEDVARWGAAPRLVAEPKRDGDGAGQWANLQAGSLVLRDATRDWRAYRTLRFWCHSAEATGDRIYVLAESETPDVSRAELAMAHRRDGFHLGDDINWQANHRDRADPAFTREWTYTLNRFGWWVDLGAAYWLTGDEKYAREWIAQMRDWVEDNPYPVVGTGNDTLTWRTIEAGIRTAGAWPESLHRFLGSPSLTGDDLVCFLKSWVEHAHHLMRITVEHPSHGGNWVTMECNGLGHLGILLPEARDSGLWLKTAVDRMTLELERQVYPDGAQKELTSGYHQVARNNFVGLLKIARHNGLDLSDEYLRRLEPMYRYNLLAADPLGFLAPLNDAGYTSVIASLREATELFDDPLYDWAATAGTAGTPPAVTSHAFEYAGQYVMRSGWGPRDLWCLFESGPYGTGHQHEDMLSLCITALGRRLLTEGGTYSYDASRYRRYVLGTWAHNTILVNGEGQRRGGLRAALETEQPYPNRWETGPELDAADGVYDLGYGPDRAIKVRHQRTVVFVKPRYWVVVDQLTPADEAEYHYDILWHLYGAKADRDAATQAAWGAEPDAANLQVTPAAGPPLDLEIVVARDDPVLGFAPAANKTPCATLDYRLQATGPRTLAWVLTPFEGPRPEVSATVSEEDGVTSVEVRHGGERRTLVIGARVTVTPQP